MTLKKWQNTLFGKWVRVSKAPPESQECVEFFSEIRKQILNNNMPCIIFHVANEYSGKKSPVFGQLQKAMGKISGMADYAIITSTGGLLIEFKRPDGKGTHGVKQKAVEAWAGEVGVPYYLVDTKEEAFEILERYVNVILK